jgi:hypothetical protein
MIMMIIYSIDNSIDSLRFMMMILILGYDLIDGSIEIDLDSMNDNPQYILRN